MKKTNSSIDGVNGFIPRRPGSQLGSLHSLKNPDEAVEPIDRALHTGSNIQNQQLGVPRSDKLLGRMDIDESLREIDQVSPEDDKKSKKRRRKEEKARRPRSKVKRIIKWVGIALLVLLLAVAGYLIYRVVSTGQSVFQGSILDVITKSEPLQQDENGRSNFLIFGTAEDDEAGTHDGPNLTDSIMVLSVDQTNDNAYMLSLPRDLWVNMEMPTGEVCSVGYQQKLNAQYLCGSDNGKDEAAGAKSLQAKVGEITGLDIQYYIHVNFTAVSETVDAVGGVDVTIESSDPRGILDRNFDWKCGGKCYYVNYKNGERVHLDGEHALALARARNAIPGGYGLPNGNFDREKNQQKILVALREKALSAGTLTNLGAVTALLNALGNNLRTNIATKEIRTIMELAKDIKQEDIISLTLVEQGNLLVTTGRLENGASIVRPVAGLYDYSDIQQYVDDNVNATPVGREKPHVTVLNGSGTGGVGQAQANRLEEEGFLIDDVDNAPAGEYGKATIYQISSDKPASAAKLKELYGVDITTGTPPVSVVGETDFLVIIGLAE